MGAVQVQKIGLRRSQRSDISNLALSTVALTRQSREVIFPTLRKGILTANRAHLVEPKLRHWNYGKSPLRIFFFFDEKAVMNLVCGDGHS